MVLLEKQTIGQLFILKIILQKKKPLKRELQIKSWKSRKKIEELIVSNK